MRRLDRVILGELIGPWIFGVVMFTVLILAGQFLFQFTNWVSKGVPFLLVAEFIVLNFPSVMALTFPMAMLLAALLGFGRLSGESEITAMKACGTSLGRIMVPVGAMGLIVSALTFGFQEFVVPNAMRRSIELKQEISKTLDGTSNQPTAYPIFEDGKKRAWITASSFNLGKRELQDVQIQTFDSAGKVVALLQAPRLKYEDTRKWSIEGKAEILEISTGNKITVEQGIRPRELDTMTGTEPEDIAAERTKDFSSQTMAQLANRIQKAQENPNFERSQLRNMEFIYWNKIAVPMAGFVYALVGAPFGIRNHRTGAAAGFWLAILIIFCYFLLGNVLGISANSGAIPPFVAAFTPVVLGICAASWAIRRKNA